MNNRERWLATMRYGSVDHPPLIPSGGWATTARRWEEEGKPKGVTLTEYFNLPPGSMHCVGARDTWVPSFEEIIRILATGKKEISAELERIRPVVEDGGYIPSCDHAVPPDVSWENYCHFIYGLKSMFGMG